MAIWMVYAAAVAILLAGGGLALERICEARGWPLRFVWLAALTLAVAIPVNADPSKGVRESRTHPADVAQATATRAPADDGQVGAGALASFGSRALLVAWGLASLVALTFLGAVLLASTRARRRWERTRIGSEDVYISDRFGPALVGIARPVVVVPRWALRLGRAVGVTVVEHEREHARAGDHLALLYAALVAVAFPWSPGIWWMCRRLGAAIEIDCDGRVMASGIPARDYGSLLLAIGAGRPGRRLFALNLADSGSLLERRLSTISRGPAKLGFTTAIMLGGLAVVSVSAACDLTAPTSVANAVGETLEKSTVPKRMESDRQRSEASDADAALEKATGPDGRVRIQGIDSLPTISLRADVAARNPRAQVDGKFVEGGLRKLLTMMDTLNFVSGGYYGVPPRVVIKTEKRRDG